MTDRIAEFKEVADEMPDDPEVRFGLAGAYLDAGQAASAVTEYRETIRLKPDYSAAYRGLALRAQHGSPPSCASPQGSEAMLMRCL
jgi:cytochrome c-type biogenesis protein CcmH/NrfG